MTRNVQIYPIINLNESPFDLSGHVASKTLGERVNTVARLNNPLRKGEISMLLPDLRRYRLRADPAFVRPAREVLFMI